MVTFVLDDNKFSQRQTLRSFQLVQDVPDCCWHILLGDRSHDSLGLSSRCILTVTLHSLLSDSSHGYLMQAFFGTLLHWWTGLAFRSVFLTILHRVTSTLTHFLSTLTKFVISSLLSSGQLWTCSVLHSGWSSTTSRYSVW